MSDYIKFEDIKPGDYFASEIGTWIDYDEVHENGVCYGHAVSSLYEEYDNGIKQAIPFIKCDFGMYANGKYFENATLGADSSNKVRYMNDEEINYLINSKKEP